MLDLLPPHYKELPVTKQDLSIASICWGFSLGFGFLTTWEAFKQTRRSRDPLRSVYIWMIWGELFVCLLFSIICWMHLDGGIKGSFWFYFVILTCWALQVQFLLQIIINRITVIISDRTLGYRIKWGVAALITAVNISVYCIWIPARLQISKKYEHTNEWWDRTEKVIYLVVDGILNWYFVRVVRQRLVMQGSAKYNKLVEFNVRIIFLSLSMDCLIIGTMSLKNGFVYMQFHPLAYTVKLNIEMSMANLIRKIANKKNDVRPGGTYELSIGANRTHNRPREHAAPTATATGGGGGTVVSMGGINVQKEVIVESRSVETQSETSLRGTEGDNTMEQEDESPLRNETWQRIAYNTTSIARNGSAHVDNV